jgi:hypothetical protein
MTDSKSSLKSISEIWSLDKPDGRYNDWGERKWIAAPSEKSESVESEIRKLQLNPRAMELYRAAKLTDSKGIEFVLFSDAQFPAPIGGIHGDGLLIPCFLPFNPISLESEARQAAMMKRGIFVYDGWIPVQEWEAEFLNSIVTLLDDYVSVLSIVGKYYAFWEPKYTYAKAAIQSHTFHQHDIEALSYSLNILDNLPVDERAVISRSLAWISNALRSAPIQRFLLLFVSLESLITYIESDKAKNGSYLHGFSGKTLDKSEMRQQRDECIKQIQAEEKSLTESVKRAYLECVQRSIRKTLEEHLNRIFGDKDVSTILFEERIQGKTLWQLRNDIAHGSVNMMNEVEIRFIESRVNTLENIARSYLRIIFNTLVQKEYFPATRLPVLTLPASHAIGSSHTEYMGPTDMAEYYLYVEALGASHVKISF